MSDAPRGQGRRVKLRIGELLIGEGLITEEQLRTALSEQKKLGLKLGQALIALGFVREVDLLELIARQLRIPRIDLAERTPDPEVARLLPETHARRFRAIVLERQGDELLVGMADPADLHAFDELQRILRKRVRLAVVSESELLDLIDRSYQGSQQLTSLAEALHEELGEASFDVSRLPDDIAGGDTAVVRLLQSLFDEAARLNASDIHIEPDEQVLRIRQRIDGALVEQVVPEQGIASALVLRLKLMASLDISEKRLPQDGRFHIKIRERNIDVRISTLPIACGESVVMRLLDQESGCTSLDELDMPPDMLARLRAVIHRPHGLVLVTGPTGSGKTTTLCGVLSELNDPQTKIITLEDPIEYRIPRVNQVQIAEKIELTFARVLRTALRQDPDVVMVGEMRDTETADMALRAAMTGHLVLSTLHTNDAVSTGLRLADMGAEGFLIASALRAVVAQRLVRLSCPHCAEAQTLDERTRVCLSTLRPDLDPAFEFRAGRGCPRCRQTGFGGRRAVFEMLELDGTAADALRRGDTAEYLRASRSARGYRPLVQSALDLAVAGLISVEEVFRVASELEDARA